MIAFAYYLLKVIVCSGILYGYYLLALRNRIFHHWNRYYLLATILLSLLLPLISIPIVQEVKQTPNEAVRMLEIVTTGDAYVQELNNGPVLHITTEQFLVLTYILISLFFLFVMIHMLLRINRMIRQHDIQTIEDFFFVNTSEKGTPFSFLRYIFWHEDIQPESAAGQHILKHEIAHVREKHTHDKLFLNLVLIVYWCNPFFWLIRREMAMIHEFIADKQSVDQQDTAAFAAMILQAAYPRHQFALTNNFFHSPIKRRLKMLIKSQNSRVTYISRILALPLIGFVVAAFTLKPSRLNNLTNSNKVDPVTMQSALPDTAIVKMSKTSISISTDDPSEKKRLADMLVVINGRNSSMTDLINKTLEADSGLNYPKNHPLAIQLYGEAARNGVMVFYGARIWDTQKKIISKDTLPPGIKSVDITEDGDVIVIDKKGNAEKISKEEAYKRNLIPLSQLEKKSTNSTLMVAGNINTTSPEPLYVVDGVIFSQEAAKEALNFMVKPENIEKIDVIKGQSAIEKYGDKGKNGVIIISTKTGPKHDFSGAKVELTEFRVDDDSPAFTEVEVAPKFPNGEKAMDDYIKKQVFANAQFSENKKDYSGSCAIRFIVDKYGKVSNFAIVNSRATTNSKLASLVIEILQKGPAWNPALLNGNKVRAFHEIVFIN